MNKLILVLTVCLLSGCIEPNKVNPYKDEKGNEPIAWLTCQSYSYAVLEYSESTADRIPVINFTYNRNGMKVIKGKCVGSYLLKEI